MIKRTPKLFYTYQWACVSCRYKLEESPQFLGEYAFGEKGYQCPDCGCTAIEIIGTGEPITSASDDWEWIVQIFEDVRDSYDYCLEFLDQMVEWEI